MNHKGHEGAPRGNHRFLGLVFLALPGGSANLGRYHRPYDQQVRQRCSMLFATTENMNFTAALRAGLACLLWTAVALGQSSSTASSATENSQYSTEANAAVPAQSGTPVSYASVSQLNGMLSQLEATSKTTQADLSGLRIERWKADKTTKEQALTNVDSIQRNLQSALPEIIGQLRASPEDLAASFKLYRNLDALYDVLGNVVELTGAFGPKNDVQALENDVDAFEGTRKQLADRIDNLSVQKEAEIVRLRTALKTAQAAVPAPPPKRVVVDDTEPEKKAPVRKKTSTKSTKPKTTTPNTPSATNPSQGQQQSPSSPQ
jgi:hypothetical protein